jgi:hypothetical protein
LVQNFLSSHPQNENVNTKIKTRIFLSAFLYWCRTRALRQRVPRKIADLKKYHQSRGIPAGHEEVNAK